MPAFRDFAQPAARRAWIQDLLGPLSEAKFGAMALELFTWQYAGVPTYRRLCRAHGVSPASLKSWRDIPAVPQQLFKLEKLFAHGSAKPAAIYETSGTTTGQPGRQHLLRTDIYRAVSIDCACRLNVIRDQSENHFLVPSPSESPRSSLSAMLGFWQEHTGDGRFWVEKNRLDFTGLRTALVNSKKPVLLCGTAFSFVHLLDAWADLPPLRLPTGSRVLETGGFKGRSREVEKGELYAQLGRLFSVRDNQIWNEYGMSELSSQAYLCGVSGLHATPPWARVLVVDPATGREVPRGQVGLVRWIDLANVDTILAVQTLDLAESWPYLFKLIGRMARTEPRGCSLGAEDLVVA